MSDQLMVSVNIVTRSEQETVKVFEVLSRAAVGLALEGVYTSVSITSVADEEATT